MAQQELDRFFVKFKCLLQSEKDVALTLKSEGRRAFVTLSLDLGHVLSEQDLPPRGGPRAGKTSKISARGNLLTPKCPQ